MPQLAGVSSPKMQLCCALSLDVLCSTAFSSSLESGMTAMHLLRWKPEPYAARRNARKKQKQESENKSKNHSETNQKSNRSNPIDPDQIESFESELPKKSCHIARAFSNATALGYQVMLYLLIEGPIRRPGHKGPVREPEPGDPSMVSFSKATALDYQRPRHLV